ncbi:MAG: hypothetical protein JWQ07_3045 [Ramlibacter sp.]|nr:hypothetical protein [Ramlibacter sp.]
MAIHQLLFWFAVLLLCIGVGVGGMYWFHARRSAENDAQEWKAQQPAHRPGTP